MTAFITRPRKGATVRASGWQLRANTGKAPRADQAGSTKTRELATGNRTSAVTWGWYAVVLVPDVPPTTEGGVQVVVRSPGVTAFWAAWWTEQPNPASKAPLPPTDACGFVVGPEAFGEAITLADRAIRAAKGRFVYARSVGEDVALRCYNRGAPTVRSSALDLDAIGKAALDFFDLPYTATPARVMAAFRAKVKVSHPDHGGTERVDMAVIVRHKEHALDYLRGARKRGEAERPVRKPRAAKKAPSEQKDAAEP